MGEGRMMHHAMGNAPDDRAMRLCNVHRAAADNGAAACACAKFRQGHPYRHYRFSFSSSARKADHVLCSWVRRL
jgi:hypothetical protein